MVEIRLANGGWAFTGPNENWVVVQKGDSSGMIPKHIFEAGITENAYLGKGGKQVNNLLDKELMAKKVAKYDPMAEALAQQWIERVTGVNFRDPFTVMIKDGQVLCQLANAIKPGIIKKVSDTTVKFKQMENISNFIKACIELGVDDRNCFETLDLYDELDMGRVVNTLHSLSEAVQDSVPEFAGPFLLTKNAGFNHATATHLKVNGC